MTPGPVKYFLPRVLLWLPVCFAVWYYLRGVVGVPTWLGVKTLMTGLFPEIIRTIEFQGHLVNVVLQFIPKALPGIEIPPGQSVEMFFSVNSLTYGYGIPLYAGLVLASPGTERQKWLRWLFGLAVLILTQICSLSLDILKTLVFDLDPAVSAGLALSPPQKELVALGYQFGTLILPPVTPLVLWVGLHREFIARLSPALAEDFTAR